MIKVKIGNYPHIIALVGNDFYNLLDSVKSCIGRKFNIETKTWYVPLTDVNLNILSYAMAGQYNLVKKFLEELSDLSKYSFLFNYQTKGVKDLIQGKTLLCDEVGLGKTLQAIVFCQSQNYKRVLIVTPAPLKRQWNEEITNFIKENSFILEGTKNKREQIYNEWLNSNLRWLIVNYEQLLNNPFLLSYKYDCIIFDEIHRIKNWKSKTYKIAKLLKSNHKIGLTATPFTNTPNELYNIVNYLNPFFFKSNEFQTKYCMYEQIWAGQEKGYINQIVGFKNLNALNLELQRIMIRRHKKDVFAELPERTYKNYYIALTPYQKKVYDHYIFQARDTDNFDNVLANLTMARIACNSTSQIATSKSALKVNIIKDESVKLDILDDILCQLDGRTLIFTQWSKTAKLIQNIIPSSHLITGDTKDKHQAIKDFELSDSKILIATDCLNYGQNLQFCQNLIHFDLPFSPSKIEQREGRIDRLTQTNKMLIIKIIAENTVEEDVASIIKEKTKNFMESVDGLDEQSITREIMKKFRGDIIWTN